jgi:GNAT superfamily N-acetyltransferase
VTALNISLRAATTEDASRVAQILLVSRKAFQPYARAAHTDDEVHAWVRGTLIPSGGVTIALSQALPVAVLATARDGITSWVTQLFVDPRFVGKGIGTTLLMHALRTLPLPIRLYTFQQNMRARNFYERHGFRAIAFTDGSSNEEHCPDVLYELAAAPIAN